MLKNAPMFKNIKGPKSSQGRGKTAIIRATVKTRGRGGASDRTAPSGRSAP